MLIDKHELSRRIGKKPETIVKMAQRREIPKVKLGHRTLRFDEAAIEKWIAKNSYAESPLKRMR